MTQSQHGFLGVLTSGGDAPGMNAAVRAVVRCALDKGIRVQAIHEGFEGLVRGGDFIRPITWDDVGGILHRGGTVIGTARSDAFRTYDGRLAAARNLVERAIDALVVIGGDGSLAGADTLRREWPGLLNVLVEQGAIGTARAERHECLTIIGLVGSIDNDMQGTDSTIGATTALHRITEAIDALYSTAASHQRTFVVEVMGRHCGFLAVMAALATGADWVLIPESPPDVEDWEDTMCRRLEAGRDAGRRASIVIVSEGAIDREGRPISASYVKRVLEKRLGEDVRETILGHVQRGGSPCARDRVMSTMLGCAAVEEARSVEVRGEARLLGISENRVLTSSLIDCVQATHRTGEALAARDFGTVMQLRGPRFREGLGLLRTLVRALPHDPIPGRRRLRLAMLHAGPLAPGMNTAVRAAVRLGLDLGHTMLGVHGGIGGLIEGRIERLDWMSVTGWARMGGAELGTSRKQPEGSDFAAIANTLAAHDVQGLVMIGGAEGYEAAWSLCERRQGLPPLDIPVVCVPASIDNNLPGSEMSVGMDTALNSVMRAVDAIKQSAVASHRAFVVEVMGGYCGCLSLMSGIATGAERVYMHEEGVTLADLQEDVCRLVTGFERGKRLGLMIRNERANPYFDTDFMCALFEEEGGDLFEVRKSILGHMQQGGAPSPFDRILAARLAARAIEWMDEQGCTDGREGAFIGVQQGEVRVHDLGDLPRMWDREVQRPVEQWWLALRPIARLLAQPGPSADLPC